MMKSHFAYIIFLLAFIAFSCESSVEHFCDNEKTLLKGHSASNEVIIDINLTEEEQFKSLINQTNINICNSSFLWNGRVAISNGDTLNIAYQTEMYCPDDTNIHTTNCFPEPTIKILINSRSKIQVEGSVVTIDSLSEKVKVEINRLFEWRNPRWIHYEIEWDENVHIDFRQKIFRIVIREHLNKIEEFSEELFQKYICELTYNQVLELKKKMQFVFVQRQLPPIPPPEKDSIIDIISEIEFDE